MWPQSVWLGLKSPQALQSGNIIVHLCRWSASYWDLKLTIWTLHYWIHRITNLHSNISKLSPSTCLGVLHYFHLFCWLSGLIVGNQTKETESTYSCFLLPLPLPLPLPSPILLLLNNVFVLLFLTAIVFHVRFRLFHFLLCSPLTRRRQLNSA